jgi:hypothetical protein
MTPYNLSDSTSPAVDEYERDLLRMLELALQNPSTGTAAAVELTTLVEKTKRYDAERFPFRTHPITGDLCSCALHCTGAEPCGCWCHAAAGA